MKINKFKIVNLHNEELFQFLGEFKQLVEESGAATLNIEALFAVFVGYFEQLSAAATEIRKSAHTKTLARMDSVRDRLYAGLVLLIRTHLRSMHADKQQAAERIMLVVDHYGDLRRRVYIEKIAAINIFLNELSARCTDDVERIGAAEWVRELASANNEFDRLMGIRFDEKLGSSHVSLRQTRRQAEQTYSKMVDRIHAAIALHGDEAYANFVNRLNSRVAHFANLIAQRKGRKKMEN